MKNPASIKFLQRFFKALAIDVVMTDFFLAVVTGHGTDRAGILDASLSRHAPRVERIQSVLPPICLTQNFPV